jgi:hypothetical protein
MSAINKGRWVTGCGLRVTGVLVAGYQFPVTGSRFEIWFLVISLDSGLVIWLAVPLEFYPSVFESLF